MKNTENLKMKNTDGRRRQIWGLLGDASPIAAAFQVEMVVMLVMVMVMMMVVMEIVLMVVLVMVVIMVMITILESGI